jgi:hypothetical protein
MAPMNADFFKAGQIFCSREGAKKAGQIFCSREGANL